MTVGLGLTQADINNKAALIAIGLRDNLDAARRFNALLNNTQIIPDNAFLQNLGFSGAEVTLLRAAFTDGNALYNVATGATTVPSVNNFLFNLQKLTGAVI